MQFRKFGKLDWDVSVLGMGCMRLPTITPGGPVDEPQAIAMIRHAIDRGVNYVDTAYPYHGGASEVVLGKALRDGYRDRTKLATKSPIWEIRQPADFDRLLDEQLARLQTDRIDFYLLHGLNRDRWKTVVELDLLSRAEAALRDGRIGHLGFSFHDRLDCFKTIVDGYGGWEFCQIQYNFMDVENQAGTEGLRYAASRGLAVIVMEPLLGGRLANPPRAVLEIWAAAPHRRSPVDWALQWVWSQPEVTLALSGMSSMEQLEENLRYADLAAVGALSPDELRLVERVRAVYLERTAIPCTKCGYCQPCPSGVNIPGVFELYNDGLIHEDMFTSRMRYERFFSEQSRASACTACRTCEDQCPQGIRISEWMPDVHAALGGQES
jgi:predicted aldo/keto reductase-like oxidoreductase